MACCQSCAEGKPCQSCGTTPVAVAGAMSPCGCATCQAGGACGCTDESMIPDGLSGCDLTLARKLASDPVARMLLAGLRGGNACACPGPCRGACFDTRPSTDAAGNPVPTRFDQWGYRMGARPGQAQRPGQLARLGKKMLGSITAPTTSSFLGAGLLGIGGWWLGGKLEGTTEAKAVGAVAGAAVGLALF